MHSLRLFAGRSHTQFIKISLQRKMSAGNGFTNKLADEKSPYLLQHQHNPIEWYPWGAEAFEKAKRLNRPIFLSVGYSTCHWCHVMEKESFENEEIARQLNSAFVSIKVDREERPDVDKLYMAFIQATTGSGGWPMTVFLTPELDPITGGTYFPPRDSSGSLGLPSVLRIVSENWNSESVRNAIGEQGQKITSALRKGALYASGESPPFDTVTNGAFQYKLSSFDEINGGFGLAPKFPKACDLEFLINHFCWTKQESEREVCRHMLEATLDGMNRGGIHDHIGKGFHRYSVDEEWHVPHFEKMLYDQTQLLGVYADYCRVFGSKFHCTVKDIADYMEECLSHEEGGFFAAEDADSLPSLESAEKREGAFCVWELSEVKELLKDLKIGDKQAIDILCHYYDIHEKGNVSPHKDPHRELQGKNVLRMKRSHEEFAEEFGLPADVFSAGIEKAKSILAEARARRPPPHLDTKIICAWQGLAISGLAKAAVALDCQQYTERAMKTVDFVRRYLMDENGCLLRAAYRGTDGNVEINNPPIRAFSDDYAFLIQGLLDLYQVTYDAQYLKMAEQLQNEMDAQFWDKEKETGYYIASDHGDVKVRVMEDQDGAEPCANSVAVGNLIRLFDILDEKEFKRKAEKIVQACSSRLAKVPYILTKMIPSFHRLLKGSVKIVVVGEASNEIVRSFRKEINAHYIWNGLTIFLDPSVDNTFLTARCPLYADMLKTEDPKVFVCANFTCSPPVTSVDDLKTTLKQLVE
uniref:Thioredox_DsbH domain-containing protein n=1 Tax=Haemonchus contortus TaxID=6289 RepID=A0A7I4Y690_HAECO